MPITPAAIEHNVSDLTEYDGMTRTERLLIIGGTGRDAGKSSLAALLISRYAGRGITGIKITPHPHPEVTGLT